MTDTLLQDLRYAARALRKTPGFTVVAVLALALGIGVNTAVFSVVNGVLLRPLPFGNEDRLYLLWERSERGDFRLASYPTFLEWRDQGGGVADLAFVRGRSASLRGDDGTAVVGGAFVSPGFFGILEARPLLGRTFALDEETGAGKHVVVLTHELWSRWFGGDRGVLGKAIALGDATYTIIGVLPSGARYPAFADFYAPLATVAATDSGLLQRGFHADSRVIAQLKTIGTADRLRATLAGISTRLAAAYPNENEGWTDVQPLPLREEILGFGAVRPILLLLTVAVALVLLIACANVANMSLVRAATRSRELAIRAALGAARSRVIRQLVTEAALLALVAGILGLLFAWWGIDLLKGAAPEGLPRITAIRKDGWVLGFTMLVSLFTLLIVGVVPALRVAAPNVTDALKAGTRAAGNAPARSRLRSSLVALEVALALVLLIGAGLLVRSFARLTHVDPGFDPARLVSMYVMPPDKKYDAAESALALYRRLAESASAVPGVEAAALSNHVPLAGALPSRIEVPGRLPDAERDQSVLFRTISAGYFRTMGIPLRRGREFTEAEVATRAPVAIVSESVARRYWPDENPIGRSATLFKSAQGRADFGQPFAVEIVGVAGDVRHTGLEDAPAAEVYIPYTVNPWGHIVLIVRTAADPEPLVPALRRSVTGVDADIPVSGATWAGGFTTMKQRLGDDLARRRFTMTLLAAFAGGALLLAALGIYGVIAYVVTLRTREIGIRAALGATPRAVLQLVMAHAARVVAIGLAAGLLAALGLTRLLANLLYGVGATDVPTFAAVTLFFVLVAAAASYVPARRATKVDPMVALRTE